MICKKNLVVHYLFSLFLCLACFNSEAQPGFSLKYDFGTAASFHNVLLKEDTLVIIGTSRDMDTNQWGVLFVKMDTMGNVIDSKLHVDSLGRQYSFKKGYSIISTSSGGYLLSGDVLDGNSDFLMWLDKEGNKVFFKEFPYGSTIGFSTPSKIIEVDDGFLVGGLRRLANATRFDLYLMKIDFDGNMLWEKYYGEADLSEGFGNFVKIDNNRFVICGSRGIVGPPPFDSNDFIRSWIFEVDSLGEVIWEWQSDLNVEALTTDIDLLPNGDWLYITKTFEVIAPSMTGAVPKIVRRNSDFNLIWEKELSPSSFNLNTAQTFKQGPDGNYVIASNWLMPSTIAPNDGVHRWSPACLTKMSPEGDSIWSRCDTVALPNIPTNKHFYSNIVILPSGNTIAVGNFDEPSSGKDWAWVVKVDKDGCLEELCTTTALEDFEKDKRIKVFPNPVNDLLYIESQITGSWSLYDVWGREVKRILVTHQGFQNEISVADLAPGVYYYNLSKDGLVLGEGKVLVQR